MLATAWRVIVKRIAADWLILSAAMVSDWPVIALVAAGLTVITLLAILIASLGQVLRIGE